MEEKRKHPRREEDRIEDKRMSQKAWVLLVLLFAVAFFIRSLFDGKSIAWIVYSILCLVAIIGLVWFIGFIVDTFKTERQRRKEDRKDKIYWD